MPRRPTQTGGFLSDTYSVKRYDQRFDSYRVMDPDVLNTRIMLPGNAPFMLRLFKGVEGFSTLFDFEVDMFLSTAEEPTSPDFSLKDMLEQPVAIGALSGEEWRWWHGMVTEFLQGDTMQMRQDHQEIEVTLFRMRIRPYLWLLTLRKNCRIFQEETTLDIILTLLKEHGVDVQDQTTKPTQNREFCVQYNETDYNFIARLMEREGIFYFFDHTKDSHTMVLCDSDTAFSDAGVDPLVYRTNRSHIRAARSVAAHHQVISKAHTTSDYFYENANTQLAAGDKETPPGTVYTHPGDYVVQQDGETLVSQRQTAQEAQNVLWTMAMNNPLLRVGYGVQVQGLTRSDMDATNCVISRLDITLLPAPEEALQEEESVWGDTYTAKTDFFDVRVPFVPEEVTEKPVIPGVQTAFVTGPDGEEICTDEYGRVHVKFHWDLSDKQYDDTSCWIRVAHGWAGPGYGMFAIPRIGHEVVVSFVNGNPDYPLITGSVYNQANIHPYVPDNPTRQGIKTATSMDQDGEGEKFNELSFDDIAGEEEVFLHAQKDYNTIVHRGSRAALIEAAGDDEGHCKLVMNRGSRSELLKEGNTTTILEKGDKDLLLKEGDSTELLEKGDWNVKLSKGNHTLTLSNGDMSVSITGNQSTEVSKNYTLDVQGDVSISVMGSTSLESTGSISIKSQQDVSIEGLNVSIKGQMNMNLEAGMNMSQEAGLMFDLKATMMTLEADLMLEAKALQTSVKATAFLQLDGSVMLQGSAGIIMLG